MTSRFIEDEPDAIDWLDHDEAEEKALKYSEDEARDDHGRWGSGQGSGHPFADAPLTKSGGAKWRKQVQKAYDSDQTFKAAIDAATLLAQGSTNQIRSASIAAAGHDKDIVSPWMRKQLDEPLSVAASPLSSYKNYFKGQDVEKADYATLREAGAALNHLIDTSPVLSAPIFRGIPMQTTFSVEPGDKIDVLSGHVISPDIERDPNRERTRVDVPNPGYVKITKLKAGDSLDLPASSFTADAFTAKEFSRGESRGQGGRYGGDRHNPAVVMEIRGARGLPIAAISPWDQKEVLTRGAFKVVSVVKTPMPSNYPRPDRNDYHIVLEPRKK